MDTRRLFLVLGAVVAVGAGAMVQAQDNPAPPPPPSQQQTLPGPDSRRMSPERQLQHLTQLLNLSQDQQDKIRPILEERQRKMRAVFEDDSLAPADRRSQMMKIRDEETEKVKAVLTDEQKQKYEAMRQRMRPRQGPPPPEGSAPQPQ